MSLIKVSLARERSTEDFENSFCWNERRPQLQRRKVQAGYRSTVMSFPKEFNRARRACFGNPLGSVGDDVSSDHRKPDEKMEWARADELGQWDQTGD